MRVAILLIASGIGAVQAGATQVPPPPHADVNRAPARPASIGAVRAPGAQGSPNVRVVAHVPLGRLFTVADIEIEQELSRPYAYVPRIHARTYSAGFSIIDLKTP